MINVFKIMVKWIENMLRLYKAYMCMLFIFIFILAEQTRIQENLSDRSKYYGLEFIHHLAVTYPNCP